MATRGQRRISRQLALAACAALAAVAVPRPALAQLKAFPEAEGFGRFATGARTSLASATVYHVTNLNDSGAGSFRDAVSQSNRFVVFDVGGIISINSVIPVSSNITIAAQTAPGGVTIYNNRLSFTSANNAISRYLAVRKGTASGRDDSVSLARGSNMIFDHMSVTWGVDETFSMNPDSGYVIDNVTIQNTIVGQGLDVVGHSAGGLMTLGEGSRFSVIKSLFADNVTRNPKVRGENEYINNVVYGWESAAYIMGDTVNETSHANAIGNYFIEGPVDGSGPFTSGTSSFNIYGSDNWVDTDRDGVLDGSLVTSYPGANVVASPFAFPTTASMTAQQALTYVLDNVGVSIVRDAVDTRIVDEVESYGTLGGVIVRESDLFPNFGTDPQYVNSRARLTDADNDGIADNWETAHGLSSSNGSDWKNLNGDGYARLEEYVNELGAAGTTRTTAGGAWTNPATWGGVTPTLADTAVSSGGISHASGNAFARRAMLDGSSTVSGGTLDVFDTMLVGAAGAGSLTMSGGTVTAGQVVLGATGQSGSLILNGGTLQTGTIAGGGGTASLTLNGGTIRFTGTPNITIATTVGAGGGTLNTNGLSGSITGGLFGAGTLTKTGSGTLTLGGNNSGYSGGINLNAGAITLATSGSNSSTGAITAANGTQINVTTSGASTPLTLANGATVTISAGGLTYNGAVNGAAGTTLLVSNSSSGTSNFSIGGNLGSFAGTLDLAASTGNIRIGGGGSTLANFDAGDSTGTFRTTFDGTTNFGSLSGGASTRLQGSTNGSVASTYVIGANGSSTSFAGTITNGTNSTPGILHITKTGTGTLTLNNAASTYTGVTTVSGGRLSVGTLANGGVASSIGQSSSAAANLVLDGGTLQYTGAAVTSDRLFTVTALGGTLDASGSGALTLNNAGAVNMSGSGDRTLTLGGPVTSFNNLSALLGDPASGKTSVTKSGAGTWRLLGSSNTYSGDTTVAGGALYLVAAGAIPSGAGKGNIIVNSGATLDLYGNSHTINGLSGAGTVTDTLNTTRTLTVGNADASASFSGTITQGSGPTLNVTKTGTGTQTFSGNLSYTGITTINGGKLALQTNLMSSSSLSATAGTLELASGGGGNRMIKAQSASVSGSGKVDLKDNKMILTAASLGSWNGSDYDGITKLIKDGRNGGAWNGNGIITSMTAAQPSSLLTNLAVATAGAVGKTNFGSQSVASTDVLVTYTYDGDANLSGSIDGDDFFRIDANVGLVGGAVTYSRGDFDLNGRVDADDYFIIDRNYGRQGTAFSAAPPAGVSVVPEPLIGLWPVILLLRRTRRCEK